MSELVKVRVDGLALDVTSNAPVVILTPEEDGSAPERLILPIWVGHFEAMAIAMGLSQVSSRRPLTHDLIKLVVTGLKGEVIKVAITELKEQTFYAVIYVKTPDGMLQIDARPSDSIALALKCQVPIYADEQLFHLDQQSGLPPEVTDPQSLKERLRRINPEDFGRYSL